MADVPQAARDAAHEATACNLGEPGWTEMLGKSPHDLIDIALDAAAPLIAAAERVRAEAIDHDAFLRSAAAVLHADRERIREGAASLAFTLHRPGNGNGEAHGSSMDVVPLAELLALIGGEDG